LPSHEREVFTYNVGSVTMRFLQRLLGRGEPRPLDPQQSSETDESEADWDADFDEVFGGWWMHLPFGNRIPDEIEFL
jgi:hypothetical protein